MGGANPCLTCKPAVVNENEAVPDICRLEYQKVSECMNRTVGSISACKVEWTEFRKCFNAFKSNKTESMK